MTVRKALQISLNVPALAVLDQVGASRLTARLAQAGATLVLPEGEASGLGGRSRRRRHQALRSGDALCRHCAAWHGVAAALSASEARQRAQRSSRLMEPVAAWYVGNVLIGTPPPENGVPGRIAFKTGTSYGYRDAWSVGFDGKYTIGVWVGRPDGAPVPGLVGRIAAAPILFDAFARLPTPPAALPRAPSGVLITTSARLPPPLRHFQPGERGWGRRQAKLHILFPPDGARLDLRTADNKPAPVPLKVTAASRRSRPREWCAGSATDRAAGFSFSPRARASPA